MIAAANPGWFALYKEGETVTPKPVALWYFTGDTCRAQVWLEGTDQTIHAGNVEGFMGIIYDEGPGNYESYRGILAIPKGDE